MAQGHIVIPLLAVASLLQPTLQVVLSWELVEERSFDTNAQSFIRMALRPSSFKRPDTTIAVKCAGRRNAPYGITIKTLEMRTCNCLKNLCPPRCRNSPQTGTVECQYAARLDRMSMRQDNFLGLICYDKVSNVLDKNMTMEDICDKWRYPGSDVPRLQIPEHLKSVDSKVLAYTPPQIEKRGFSWTFFKNNWPKNEKERTGFGGIGGMEKLGPNPVLYFVITGQVGFEFKVISEEGAGKFALPLYFPDNRLLNETFIRDSAKRLAHEMGSGPCPDGELALMVQHRRVLHDGYLKHPLNTDNAWMEGRIVHIHDFNGNCFGLNYWGPWKDGRYSWVTIPMYGGTWADYVMPLITPLIANYK